MGVAIDGGFQSFQVVGQAQALGNLDPKTGFHAAWAEMAWDCHHQMLDHAITVAAVSPPTQGIVDIALVGVAVFQQNLN